jgi:hypothetical protein
MKIALFCLVIFTTLLSFACTKNIESSPISANEKPAEKPLPDPTPHKFEEIDLQQKFSKMENDNLPSSLKIAGYEIKTIALKKKDEYDNPEAEIYNVVLSKKGKTIARFGGEYNPLGNFMSFGTFPFLGGSKQQLLVFDESNKYERDWIVSLTPKYEVLFDSEDYGIWWGRIGALDIDKDGIYEVTELQSVDFNLALSGNDFPWTKVVFKFDAKTSKYTPANHIFTDYSLDTIDEQITEFKEGRRNAKRDFLEIMLRYFYAGKNEAAWQFFDENFSTRFTIPKVVETKEQLKERIKGELNKDPVYKFIKADRKRNNKN